MYENFQTYITVGNKLLNSPQYFGVFVLSTSLFFFSLPFPSWNILHLRRHVITFLYTAERISKYHGLFKKTKQCHYHI